MAANLTAALSDLPSTLERERIENDSAARHGAATNYFQEKSGLVQPTAVKTRRDADRIVVEWNTALAGPQPIRAYEVKAGDKLLVSLPYRPQLTEALLSVSIPAAAAGESAITVTASTGV